MLLLALGLLSCGTVDSDTAQNQAKPAEWVPPVEQEILFEVSYVNFAWGYTLGGFYVDRDGDIYEFHRGYDDERWQRDDPDRLTAQDLHRKYAIGRELVGTIDSATLDWMTNLIPGAQEGELTERISVCRDFGGRSWVAYMLNESTGDYERVLLYAAGDWARRNRSGDAEALFEWLRSVAGDTGEIACGCPD